MENLHKMKILLITPFYPPNIGGVETSLFTLVKLLKHRGIETRVVSYKGVNSKLFELFEGNKLLQFLYLFPCLFLKSVFTMVNPTIIHGAGIVGGFIAKIVAKIKGVPYVVSTHCIYDGIYKIGRIERWILRGAKTVLCLSEKSKKEIGLPNCVVYRTLIDWELFKPIEAIPTGTVLFIGRPIAKKGWNIAKQLPNVVGISDIPNESLPRYYSMSWITITAAQYKECFSRVILESLFCDTPVIASNKDVAKDIIPHDVVQFVEPTVESLKKAIKNFKRKPKGFYRDYAMKEFGEKNLEVFINAYNI